MVPEGSAIEILLHQAEADYRAGRYDEVEAALTPHLRATPIHPSVPRLLGLCALRHGDPMAALPLLEQAVRLAPTDPWAQLHHAMGLQALGRHQEAAARLRACQAGLPHDPAPLLNLAVSLMALGDLNGAARAANRARLRAPGMAETHYTVGLVRLCAGAFDQACAAFTAATQRAPRFAEAWVNLGIARYRFGDMAGAADATATAAAIDPDHVTANVNLAAFWRLTGNTDAADDRLRTLLARHPGAAEARVGLAASLLLRDKPAEALALLDLPPPEAPLIRQHWRLQQALALLQLDRPDDARLVLEGIGSVLRSLAPLLTWRHVLLAAARSDGDGAIRLAEQTEAELAATPDMLPEHRIMALYDLARFWSSRDERDRTFTCWQRAHQSLRRFQPFSRADQTDFVEATITAFDRTRLHHGARAGNADPAPVFIVGMPRSGTTLMEQILAAHPAVFGAGERTALGQLFARLGGAWDRADAVHRLAGLGQPVLDTAAEAYLRELHALAPEATHIVDKMPGNFRLLGLVGLMLPGARIIHCTRDPRDIGLSIFTFRFYGHHPYAHDLGDLGWYIAQHHERLMAHWRAVLPNPILPVRLDDWIEDFDATLRRVLAFLGLPYDRACERFYEQRRDVRTVSRRQVMQPINASGIGRWRSYERHLSPLIDELARAGLVPPSDGRP